MSSPLEPGRLEELLADRALDALETEDLDELSRLLGDSPHLEDPTYEYTAAALELAFARQDGSAYTPLPSSLSASIEQRLLALTSPGQAPKPRPAPDLPARHRMRLTGALGWLVAAGLAIVIAWPASDGEPAEAREQLVHLAKDLVTWSWRVQAGFEGSRGDVVWSPQREEGYMRLSGWRINDPASEQYQLWIFDRDQANPIDGGVFDVSSDGDVIVPIDAKLGVGEAYQFAVTIEKPGGVVVSGQDTIVAVALP
ncbi:MAG: anti-sigma factor [Planctomycetota bacterium]